VSLLSRLLRWTGGSAARAASRLLVVACGLVLAVLWLAPSAASAAQIHVFSSSFGSAGSGAGQVSSPQGVAVDDATGDVYVADTGNARVDEFDSSGNFVRAWGWGVADGASSFESCTTSCQAGISGSGAGQFESPVFVAVDNSTGPSAADVYVGDTGDHLVTKFDASGNLVSSWGNATPADGQLSGSGTHVFSALSGISVDGSGNLNVYDPNGENWFVFDQTGAAQRTIAVFRGTSNVGVGVDSNGNLYKVLGIGNIEQFSSTGTDIGNVSDGPGGGNVSGFAIDPATTDVYADDAGGTQVEHYAGSGLSSCVPAGKCEPAETFGSGHLTSGAGVAFNAATGAVYVADKAANQITVFGALTIPDVTTGSASNTASRSATLNGTINADGTTVTDCHFDYGTTTSYGQIAACVPASPSGTSAVAVQADVTGLAVGTTYHFQLEASNGNGTNKGSDATFATPPPPSIDSASSTNFTASSADLSAQINPGGLDTTYHIDWGSSTSYGHTVPVPDADIGAGTSDVAVSQHLAGLTANVEYHWRVVATNASGTVDGADHTFTYPVAAGGPDTCPNAAFRQGLSAGLPDCRAYEMVTPPNKNGAQIELESQAGVVASDGSSVIAGSPNAFAGLATDYLCDVCMNDYQFNRTSAGWITTPLNPPLYDNGGGIGNVGLENSVYVPSAAGVEVDQLLLKEADGSVADIGPVTPPSKGPIAGFQFYSVAAAADASKATVIQASSSVSLTR